MSLDADLKRIVKRAQAEGKCLQCGGTGVWRQYDSGGGLLPPGAKHICKVCHGTGQVPDPRLKGLAEALTEECPGKHYEPCYTHQRRINCADAGCSGRVLRSEWQQGELAGVLTQWTGKRCDKEPWATLHWAILAYFGMPDCNEQAAETFLKFIKEATHATE